MCRGRLRRYYECYLWSGGSNFVPWGFPILDNESNRRAQVTITDYPAQPILDAITANVQKNISPDLRRKCPIDIHGHQWNVLDTSFAASHAHRFTRILAADCLWMLGEHENLAKSMAYFLSDAPEARVFVIAGFHTGRAKVVPFFEETIPEVGLEVEEIYEMDAEGRRRPWAKERNGGREDFGERKKWCVLARLRRRGVQPS